MEYIMGLDGGGTKTDCYIFDKKGHLVSFVRGGSTNHEKYSEGFEEMMPVFDEIVGAAMGKLGIEPSNIKAAVFGMAGIDVPHQKTYMENYLEKKGFQNAVVINDSFLGIKAGCSKGQGICFVNGTGNSVGGIDAEGSWLQVGGLGEYFGDLNGAGGMSGAVICAVYSMFYRCGEKTSMAEKFFELLGIDSHTQFAEAIYDKVFTCEITDKDIHGRVLYPAAEEGDKVALDLLRSFGERFALSIAGCINNLQFGDEVEVVLVGSGSLKARSSVMLDHCGEMVQKLTGKKITMLPLLHSPAAGAVIWASEMAFGREHTDAICAKIIEATK